MKTSRHSCFHLSLISIDLMELQWSVLWSRTSFRELHPTLAATMSWDCEVRDEEPRERPLTRSIARTSSFTTPSPVPSSENQLFYSFCFASSKYAFPPIPGLAFLVLKNLGLRLFAFFNLWLVWGRNFGRHYLNNVRFRRRLEQEQDYSNTYVCSRTLTSHPRQTSGHKVKAYPNTTPADKKCTMLVLHFEKSESRAWWSRHCLRLLRDALKLPDWAIVLFFVVAMPSF